MPGLGDPRRLLELLGRTAKLEFRLVGEPGANPADVDMLDQADQPGKLPVEKQVMVQGEDLTDAQPGFNQQTGQPVVNFRFNLRGGQAFGTATAAFAPAGRNTSMPGVPRNSARMRSGKLRARIIM